ncbi:MAG: hypothetical protein HKM05_03800 [Spirochaetales bacterium]|nr:hypothetical protein [Spirochaetales bacterium]
MMDFLRSVLNKHPQASQRFLEILPGFVSWNMILFPVWGAFFAPKAVALFLMVFYVYWLVKSLNTALMAWKSQGKIRDDSEKDFLPELKAEPEVPRIKHIVIIPTYKEPAHTLIRTLEALEAQSLGAQHIIPVIAFEERAGEEINAARETAIRERFSESFSHLMFTRHPASIPGEVVGKSSNMAWAARELQKIVETERGWDRNYLTVTSVDSDVCFHANYFASLTLNFLRSKNRHRRIWQGAIMFYNNIDKIPMVMRVFNRLFTVISISGLGRENGRMNFSSYSLSWRLLEHIGFWDVDVIPEDFRVFFKSYFATAGEVKVEPIWLPVMADAAEADGFWSTFVNTYEQVKRWAWGASDDSYILKRWIQDTHAPFWDKTRRVSQILEIHFLWPVNWFILMIGIPLLQLVNPLFMLSGLGQDLMTLTGWTLLPTIFALVVFLLVDLRSQPNFKNLSWGRKVLYPLEMLFITPISSLIFSAIPSLDAHTRLLAGKYLEYRVTEKV